MRKGEGVGLATLAWHINTREKNILLRGTGDQKVVDG